MNLLITGAWTEGKDYTEELETMGHSVVHMQYEQGELPCDYGWVEGVVCNGLFLRHAMDRFVNLQYIQLTSAGYDRISLESVKKRGIAAYNAAGVYAIPMAEFAVAGVLQIYKRMEFFRRNQEKRLWEKYRRLMELYGRTVCVIGCGDAGTECAKRFRVFGCRVIGVNRSLVSDDSYETVMRLDDLDEALAAADIVILTIALTEETRYLINRSRLDRMKDSAILVNLSRGSVVDERALTERIGKIGGAVLDVFEEEPLPEGHPLWEQKNVIVTPHNSFAGEGNAGRLSGVIMSNLETYRN